METQKVVGGLSVSEALCLVADAGLMLPEPYRPQLWPAREAECGVCGGMIWLLSHDHDRDGFQAAYEPAFYLCRPCKRVRSCSEVEGALSRRAWPEGECEMVHPWVLLVPSPTKIKAEPRLLQRQIHLGSRGAAPTCKRCGMPYSSGSDKEWCRDCRQKQADVFREAKEEKAKAKSARQWMDIKRRRGNYDDDFAQRLYEGVVLLRAGEDGEVPGYWWPHPPGSAS